MSLDKPECHKEYRIYGWTLFGAVITNNIANHFFAIQNGGLASGNIFIFGTNTPDKFIIKRHTLACFNGGPSSMTTNWSMRGVLHPEVGLVTPAGVFIILESQELDTVIFEPIHSHRGQLTWAGPFPGAGAPLAVSTWLSVQEIDR